MAGRNPEEEAGEGGPVQEMGAPRNLPKTSRRRKSTTLGYLFKLESTGIGLPGLPPPSYMSEIEDLVSMIIYCTYIFTFTDPSESESQHELKQLKLIQILSYLHSPKQPLSDRVLSSLVSMISANLFRPLPPPAFSSTLSLEQDSISTLIPSWPHLQIVYDILSAFVAGTDYQSLRSHIDRAFLLKLLSLFQSEDPRERDRLKSVCHQLYSKLKGERAFMRQSMSNIFLQFVSEMERHCGIEELLEIWGSIIHGFAFPLKKEHRQFLMRVLMPLHKPKGMAMYHRQLSYCVLQFVEKEPELGGVVVKWILKHWPVTNCQKEVLLIGELEELVDVMEQHQLDKLTIALCSQVAKCLNACNFQVAERALYVWKNERFVRMASQSMDFVFPILVECIEKNIRWHWSKQIKKLTTSVKKMVEDMEPGLYSKCVMDLDSRKSMVVEEEMKRRERWERLEIVAGDERFLQHVNFACL